RPAAPARNGGSTEAPQSPAVRKLIAESGIDAAAITPSGKDGRLAKADVVEAVAARAAAAPAPQAVPAARSAPAPQPLAEARAPVPPDQSGREQRVPMTRLRQTIARRLKDAQNTAAMLTTFNEVDMSAVIKLRNQYKDLFERT